MTETFHLPEGEENKILRDRCGENILTECTEDFILPDYMPEIRKLLRLDAKAVPTGHFIGSDRIEAAGSILYTLLYAGADGKITSVPLHSDYTYTVPAKDYVPTAYVCRDALESVQCRPAGPRKVSIRARIAAKPHAYIEEEGQIPLQELCPLPAEKTEKLLLHTKTAYSVPASSGDLSAEVTVPLDGFTSDNLNIKYSNGEILLESARAEEGKILCRGTAYLRVLIEKEDGEVFLQHRKVPFEAEITADGVKEGDAVTAYGLCQSVEAEILPRGENDTDILLSALYRIEGEAWRNRPLTLYTDVYAEEGLLHCSMRQEKITCFTGVFCGNFTVDGTGEYKEEETGDVSVIDTSLSVHSASIALSSRKAVLTGEMSAQMLICFTPTEGEARLGNAEIVFPFRLEAEMPNAVSEKDRAEFVLSPVFAQGKADRKNLSVSGEVALTVRTCRDDTVSIPDKIEISPLTEEIKKTGIRVYYPKEGDSLWSVGKKYRVPLSALRAANGIPESEEESAGNPKSLDGMNFILVPAVSAI